MNPFLYAVAGTLLQSGDQGSIINYTVEKLASGKRLCSGSWHVAGAIFYGLYGRVRGWFLLRGQSQRMRSAKPLWRMRLRKSDGGSERKM